MTNSLQHGTCIAIGGQGVLLLGASGCGKSDLALRLIHFGAQLVADDQVQLQLHAEQVIASAPVTLAGLLEIFGHGIVRLSSDKLLATAPLALAIEILPKDTVPERMPELDYLKLLDRPIRRVRLGAHHPSTPAKIFAMLAYPLIDP